MEEKGDGKAWRDTIAAGHLNRETPSDPTGHLFSEFPFLPSLLVVAISHRRSL